MHRDSWPTQINSMVFLWTFCFILLSFIILVFHCLFLFLFLWFGEPFEREKKKQSSVGREVGKAERGENIIKIYETDF